MKAIEIRRQIIEVELISLKARKAYAEDLVLSQDMIVEVKLLNAQIEALRDEWKRIFEEKSG
jgi:hypothetical protein